MPEKELCFAFVFIFSKLNKVEFLMKMLRFLCLAPFVFFFSTEMALASEERAKGLYKTCLPCHGETGAGNETLQAPAIAGMSEWYLVAQLKGFRKGARGRHHKDLAGMRMKPLADTLRDSDVPLIAKYVSKMPRQDHKETLTGGRVLKGEAAYAVCAACHGADGRGVKASSGPDLTIPQDWYLLTQLKNFKSGIRGADPAKDPSGAIMAPMASTLADEQAMKDIIRYIQSLR